MDHRAIGELSVSVVGVGCNQFGTSADKTTTAAIVHEALDSGLNFFDTADEYGRNYADPNDPNGWGRSEELLGEAVQGRRDEVVIASKFGIGRPGDPDSGGASAGWITTAVEHSLRRLGTDRIDLYQLHFPDAATPIEETLAALDRLVRDGKVREIGCCNLSSDALADADAAARQQGLRRFVSVQAPLNVIQRGSLDDVLPACERLGLAFIPYYPLASGMLTGKYRRGEAPPAGARLTEQVSEEARARLLSDRTFKRLEALEGWAAGRGHSLLELAFAWLLGHREVATVIAGAAKPGQAAANAEAARWTLTPDEVAEVTTIVRRAVTDTSAEPAR
jgi:aryl-alcohol dehydrogenase-like predicted oxidoreductase